MDNIAAIVHAVYAAREWEIQITPEARQQFDRYVVVLRAIPGLRIMTDKQGGRFNLKLMVSNQVIARIWFFPDWRIREIVPEGAYADKPRYTASAMPMMPDELRNYVAGLMGIR
jgi:hypothetical protein